MSITTLTGSDAQVNIYLHVRCVGQCFPTLFLEAHQQCTFWMSPLSDQYISGPGVSGELIQVCLIRKSWKICSVGVPPGTGLGDTGAGYAARRVLLTFTCAKIIDLKFQDEI